MSGTSWIGVPSLGIVEAEPAALNTNAGRYASFTAQGAIRVALVSGGAGTTGTPADDFASPGAILETMSFGMVWDAAETNWDREKGNVSKITAAGVVTGATPLEGVLATGPVGMYNTTDPTLANGDISVLQVTTGGFLRDAEQFAPQAEDNTNGIILGLPRPLSVSTYTRSVTQSNGAAGSNAVNIKASAGNLFSVIAYNTNAATRFLFFVNSASAPVAGSATIITPIAIPTNTTVLIGEDLLAQTGLNFSTGIGLAFMTTIAGGTLATGTECFVTAFYK